jgi:hypothetical protein
MFKSKQTIKKGKATPRAKSAPRQRLPRKNPAALAVQALTQPANYVGAQNTWGGSVGSGTMVNTNVKKHKTPIFVDELWCELNSPTTSALVLLAAGNIQPGLAPMTNFTIPSPWVANTQVTPGLGPVADANINPLPNAYGLVKRTNVMSVCYDKWDCDSLDIIYDPGCSGQSTQGSVGEIIIHAEPNVSQSAPGTLVEALRSKYSVSGRACDRIMLRLPRSFFDRKKDFFVRQGPVPWSASITDFDAGRIHVMCNGLVATSTGELGRLSVRANFHLYDDIDPAEATSITVAPSSSSVLFGITQGNLPVNSGSSNTILQCLCQGDAMALDSTGLPLKYNTNYTSFSLPPGNYGFEAYFNPNLSANSVAGVTGSVLISTFLTATNANSGVITIANDLTSLYSNATAVALNNVTEDRTVIVRGYWRSPGSLNTSVAITTTLTLAGFAAVAWGIVGNNWTGAPPNAASGNVLGGLLRVYTL